MTGVQTCALPIYTYGPRQSARAVIPTIITQIASGRRAIHLGSQQPTRDFSYVQDTVRGFIAALESDQGLGEVVNLGSGFEISIGDTLSLIAELMQVEVQVEEDLDRLRPAGSEVYRLLADNSKAKRLFGWEPQYAQLEGFRRGLSKTIPWFTNPENLNEYKPDKYNL